MHLAGHLHIYGSVSICSYIFIIIAQTEGYRERPLEYATQVLDCSITLCYSLLSVQDKHIRMAFISTRCVQEYVNFNSSLYSGEGKERVKGKAVFRRTVMACGLLRGVVELSVDVI